MRRLLLVFAVLLIALAPARLHAGGPSGPDFSAFAGPWLHHSGAAITVDADGTVWVTGGFGELRDSPPRIMAQLGVVRDGTAYGYDASDGAPFWMTVIPEWDVVLMSGSATTPWTLLCGEAVPPALYHSLLDAGLAGASGCGT